MYMMKLIIMPLVALMLMVTLIGINGNTNVFASHGTDFASCNNDGLYDGENGAFSQGLYDMCGDTYYEAFIEGCMSEDNSRDVCESATDAGE